MNEKLQRLRNAVVNRGREVEVTPEGTVREIQADERDRRDAERQKPTKLAARTFGS